MNNLVIMPTENRERMNLGEFAEEATIIEETATPKRVNHFICKHPRSFFKSFEK